MVDPKWVLAMMLAAQPNAPWRASYEKTAEAIAKVASAKPLFSERSGGADRTAALIVSVAWFEGTFRPDAEGDHECLERDRERRCVRKGAPRSFCTMQVHESNFRALGVTRELLTTDIEACIDAGVRMMRVSFTICRNEPEDHRLDQYATGGGGCMRPPNDEGAHRWRKGAWLFAHVPRP